MAICYLFTQHLDEESCLSIKLNQQGKVEAPLAMRSFAEIKTLQAGCQTYLVAPGQRFSIYPLEMPWLPERKAREAIPFALEEKLAQNFNTLHFAFDRYHYLAGHYLIVVGDKQYLQELINLFDSQDINFDFLTLDWFALKTNEIALMETSLLANDKHLKGSITPDLFPIYFATWTEEQTIYCFPDSYKMDLGTSPAKLVETEETSYLWLAQRLHKNHPMNLCQGELQHGSSHIKTKRLYQAAAGMCLLWLVSVLTINAIKIYTLNRDIEKINAKIAVIYREFFPNAKQIINPKFRINQLIKSNQNSAESSFWTLLDKLATTFKTNTATIEQIRFQNQTLTLTLATKNFESLEDLQNKLQRNKVKVKQTQASTNNNQVVSTLELTL